MKKEKQRELLEWFEAIVFSFSLLVFVFSFFFRVVTVDGESMVPTLSDGDRLVIHSSFSTLHQGDVVVLDGYIDYDKPLVKRVIAMGGDTVFIDGASGTVTVNDVVLQEDYIAELTTNAGTMDYPVVVPEGYLFVMGDNRLHSLDSRSRSVGMISQEDILGTVFFRIFPITKAGSVQ